jgi:hypothetical protein
VFAFKCRLQVLGVIREDVGQGTDYKSAATDAFKRAAVRFGIGHELYSYEQNWVQVDGDGKYRASRSKIRRGVCASSGEEGWGRSGAERGAAVNRGAAGVAPSPAAPRAAAPRPATPPNGVPPIIPGVPKACPECGGELWDNRAKKASGAFAANAPDFRCKDKGCDKPIWLDGKKGSKGKNGPKGEHNFGGPLPGEDEELDESQSYEEDEDTIPF